MNPITKLISYTSLLLGTTTVISSNHWVTAWVGLEINTLAIIPMISKSHHPRAIEATIKYFLVQAVASAMVLFSSMTNAWSTGQWDITCMSNPTACLLLTLAIAMKLGLAPFHFWLPEVLQGSSLITALLLSTVMKLPPISILAMTADTLNSTSLIIMAILSAAIGGWMGLNQTQIRKILAFSSISHLGWTTIIIVFYPKLALLTFYLYSITTSAVFLTLNTTKTTKLPTMMTSWAKSPALNATLMLSLLSLAGLPPLTGFLPKWLIIQELAKQEMTTAATIITMLSLLGLFFYLRLAYHSTITLSPNTSNHMKQWHPPKTMNTSIATLAVLSIALLPLSPTTLTAL
uniref:NADH-ubiquinone oxidoreductase chain 2 n=1 Tax=Rhinopomastus cyanomelas TaxID=113115 RepID=A0A7G9TVN9_RHICY|nr:NADH dehydrogenase subunit 2 [Rhinopomastus cyanomelas]QNN84432.1 NADH dehydrogenase subunit 2 [Rhinopomastus cyanomelas]